MIDSHCHLYIDRTPQQQEQLVHEAVEAGVSTIINIGIDVPTSEQSLQFARQFSNVFVTAGVHPHDARRFNEQIHSKLRELANQPQVVAVGETGLDFYRNLSPADVQKDVFEKQLQLAVEIQKPVVVHTRNSFADTFTIVKKYADELKGGVFHCFQGTSVEAQKVVDLGFHVSFGGIMTYKDSMMAEVARRTRLDRIILETDAPYLTPVPFRGKPNRPAYVRFVYEKLAELKEMSFSETEKQIDINCQKLFGLVETFGG